MTTDEPPTSIWDSLTYDWNDRTWYGKLKLAIEIPVLYSFLIAYVLVVTVGRHLGRVRPKTRKEHDDPDIKQFDAAADDQVIGYVEPDDLPDRSERGYIVYTERRVTIDPDRIAERVDANYDDETCVTIRTKHGDEVYTDYESID